MEFMEYVPAVVQNAVTTWGLKVVAAIAILVIGRWLAGVATRVIKAVMTKAKQDEMLVKFLGSIVYYALLAFVVIAAISQLGVQTTSVIAVFGAAGLAIGLALQGSLANFAAGVMLIVFKPFKVGDYVEAAGTAGTIEGIMIFNTRLKTPDNKMVWVPNGKIFDGNIINYNASDTRRVDMVFGCSYEDDLTKAKSILEDLLKNDDRILADPAATVKVSALADSSVNFNVRPWVKTPDYWAVYWDLTEKVKLRFDEEGISIPYPQRDIHVHQAAA
ncbi:MAG: mechanosensitive ion channel [Gammaproteobacteria bacterium]|nr:mechanosensitive ion channel [Gammaproteobacteria bacterium]MDH3411688.1 mechanosensitive ion channel [Gammaproteobacteria bacterium]